MLSDASQQFVDLAYGLWLARAFRSSSPQDELLTAVRRVKGSTSSRLFLVSKSTSVRSNTYPITALRLNLGKGGRHENPTRAGG